MDSAIEDDAKARVAPFANIVVIGLGLIGASLAASIKKAFPDVHILGVDTDSRTRVVAKDSEWVDIAASPEDAEYESFVKDKADLVVFCAPIAGVDDHFQKLGEWGYSGMLTDTVSTKAHILEAAKERISPKCVYIPGHPMSGAETSGIDAARSDLFEGTNWILCPDEATPPESFKELHDLIRGINSRIVSLPREDHDSAVAIVSHVPHIVAAALMELACRHSDDAQSLMRLAAGGFKDTTRIAAGSPTLWSGIAFDNSRALSDGLDEMVQILATFKDSLAIGDKESFKELLSEAAEARAAIPAAWVPSSEKLLEVRVPMVDRNGVVAEVATIASSVGCNIQSIEIEHISEGNAMLSLILTDEGDIGQLSYQLIEAGYSVSFSPIKPKEHGNVS